MGDDPNLHGAHPGMPEGEGGAAMLDRMNTGDHERLATWGLALLETKVAPTARMLDIGCGGGANLARLFALAPKGHATGIDHARLSVEKTSVYNATAIEAGICDVLQADVGALPFKDASFDVVTAFETVYFWPDIERAFAEVHRALASGGLFLVCNEVDGTRAETYEFAKNFEGMHVYTNEQLVALLEAAGFSTVHAESEPIEHWARIMAFK